MTKVVACGWVLVVMTGLIGVAQRETSPGVERLTSSNRAMNGNAAVAPDGRIAFVSNRTGAWQVWVMAGDGTGARQLTFGAGTLGYASWTRDSRHVLFHREVDGIWGLYQVDVATAVVTAVPFKDLVPVHRLRPTMTPAGRLLFDRRLGRDDERFFALATSAPDGSSERTITSTPAYHSDARISPDGRRIVWQVGTGAAVGTLVYQIHVMNADGSSVIALTDGHDSSKYPKWSPDGRRIVYTVEARNDSSNREVWVMNADGGSKIRVTNRPGIDFDASWSAEGRSIIYTTDQFGGRELVRAPITPATRTAP